MPAIGLVLYHWCEDVLGLRGSSWWQWYWQWSVGDARALGAAAMASQHGTADRRGNAWQAGAAYASEAWAEYREHDQYFGVALTKGRYMCDAK